MRYVKLNITDEEKKAKESRNGGPGIFGDKEFLLTFLSLIPTRNGTENRRFNRLCDALEKCEDDGYWQVEEDDWKWVREGFEKTDLSIKSQSGEPIFHPILRRGFARVNESVEVAPTKVVEEVKSA